MPLALAALVLLPFLASSCSSGSSGGSSLATVSGRVLDDLGFPVAGALVEIASDPVTTTTNSDGLFLVEMAAGEHRMVVSTNGVTVCEACFTLEKGRQTDLGDLYPGHTSDCGGPVFCAGDMDCDGISDADELAGWEVRVVLGDGVSEVTEVCVSDPTRRDSDGDGLSDLEELAARTDPSRRDTDGDLLPDFAELNAYKSNPCMMDSDGDSMGPDGTAISDPNLWDGFELQYLRTSPTMADTDGDGLTDWEEIHSGGTNPRIADLPSMGLNIHGDPTLILDITSTNTVEAITSTLERDSESYEKTDTESTKMSIENTVHIHSELEAGTGTWPPSYNAKITTDTLFKHGYFTESMASWTESSVRESQDRYEVQDEYVTSWDDGRLAVAVKIVNSSDLSFKVKDLRVTAYRQSSGGSFSPVGNLIPGDGFSTDPGGRKLWNAFPDFEFILGPSAEVTLLVGADSLPTQIMRALVANPTALLFEIGSYSLFQLDDLGVNETVNFAKLGEDVIQRTGLVVIDFGDGQLERYMVATNVYRYPDGSGRGLTLREALNDVVGIDYASQLAVDAGRRVLTRVRTRSYYTDAGDEGIRGFWIVGSNSPAFDEPLTDDFDDVVLQAGERVSLTFVEDRDGDGLFDREEYLLDTDATAVDTDGDELDDYEESKVGWDVAVQGRVPYRVFSDPRFFDLDQDYLSDLSERSLGTDPYLADTDGDGYHDAFDSDPLVPPCLDGTPLNLAAWWTGDAVGDMAQDAWTEDGVFSDALMSDPDISYLLGEDNKVFYLNPEPTQRDQFLDAPTEGLSPTREYTVAAWLYWQGVSTGEDWGTILTKGDVGRANYALLVSRDGVLRHGLYRYIHEQCWHLGNDWSCADDWWSSWTIHDSPAGMIPLGEWVHVVATFGGDWMRLYIDGVQLEPRKTSSVWWTGWFDEWKHYRHTEYLHANAVDLRIGGDPPDVEGPFRGFLDDVKYFHRALTPEEIEQLYLLGVCRSDP